MKKIINISEIPNLVNKLRQEGKKIVVCGGCFDLLHIGHITLLENAKKKGDFLIVLLEGDKTIKKKGANRPIHTQQERAHMLASLEVIDTVVLLSEDMNNMEYDNVILAIKPSIIATTENDASIIHKERQAALVGAKVIAVNKHIPSVSTSKLLTILSKEI